VVCAQRGNGAMVADESNSWRGVIWLHTHTHFCKVAGRWGKIWGWGAWQHHAGLPAVCVLTGAGGPAVKPPPVRAALKAVGPGRWLAIYQRSDSIWQLLDCSGAKLLPVSTHASDQQGQRLRDQAVDVWLGPQSLSVQTAVTGLSGATFADGTPAPF